MPGIAVVLGEAAEVGDQDDDVGAAIHHGALDGAWRDVVAAQSTELARLYADHQISDTPLHD